MIYDNTSYCTDCKKTTRVAYHEDIVCRECGLVLGPYTMWETSDFNCVGAATEHGHLTTTISKPGKMYWGWLNLKSNRSVIRGVEAIATMSDKLGVTRTVKDRAESIYHRVSDGMWMKRTKKEAAVLVAACVYVACGEVEPKQRTLKEICSVANGATEKEICSVAKNIDRFLEDEMSCLTPIPLMGLRTVGEFAARYCDLLRVHYTTMTVAKEVVKKLEQIDDTGSSSKNNPGSVAAAVMYMVTQLSIHDKRCLKEISAFTRVAESTISDAYKDVYPYASRLIPSWFAQENDLNNLAIP